MNDRFPASGDLGVILARMPEPAMPADLAGRIVAGATALPQQTRREQLVTVVPAVAPPSRIARRPWLAGGAGAALAASLALAFVQFPGAPGSSQPAGRTLARDMPVERPQPAPVKQADKAIVVPEVLARAEAPVVSPAGPAHRPQPARRAVQVPDEAALQPLVDPPAPPEVRSAQLEQPAAASLPSRPVQGPPVPDDIKYGFGRNGQAVGFGYQSEPGPAAGAGEWSGSPAARTPPPR